MGAESSKENNRNSTVQQNRSQNHRPRQNMCEEAAPAYQATHTYQLPPQAQQAHLDRSRNLAQDLQNTRIQTIQTNNLERTRNPYTTQNLTTKQGPPNTLERSRQPYNINTEDLQIVTQAKPQNLYPTLAQRDYHDDSFVVVNNYGPIRPNSQPSAPPASELNTLPDNRTAASPTQQFSPSHNAPGPSNSANPSANLNKNRPRSAVRTRNNKDTLSCPTCSQRLGIAIFQCSGGHSSCKECRMANRRCGTCMSPITDMRNIMLEAYIADLKSPCCNQGCTLRFNADDMEQHLKECPFGEMDCPMGTFFGQCKARCKVADMAAHFDIHHKEQRTAEIDKEMYVFNICMETHKMHLIKNGPYTYLVHVKVGEKERKIFMTVQLLGTKISSQKWTYEFHVYNKRQPSRKFLFADSCQSIGKPVDEIFKENQCATLPLPYAMTFVNESTLTYKFYIKKEINQRARKGGPKKTVNTEN